MRSNVRRLLVLAFVVGLFAGMVPPVAAVSQFSFAGYKRETTNKGSRANIGYKNPTVTKAGTLEWVMVGGGGDGQHYFQVGWLKYPAQVPKYFAERGCDSVCRYEFENVPTGTTHLYEVEYLYDPANGGDNWCAKIDGYCRLESPDALVGLGTTAPIAYWSGETWDTDDNLGGTAASHLRFAEAMYKGTDGNWTIPATGLLVDVTTAGTRYRASKGTSGIYTYVDNWTE